MLRFSVKALPVALGLPLYLVLKLFNWKVVIQCIASSVSAPYGFLTLAKILLRLSPNLALVLHGSGPNLLRISCTLQLLPGSE